MHNHHHKVTTEESLRRAVALQARRERLIHELEIKDKDGSWEKDASWLSIIFHAMGPHPAHLDELQWQERRQQLAKEWNLDPDSSWLAIVVYAARPCALVKKVLAPETPSSS